MKQLKDIILEKILINKDVPKQKDAWDKSDFDDTEVNYYVLDYVDVYNSLAGQQKMNNRYYFIIWNKEKLSTSEIEKLISDNTDFFAKTSNKRNKDVHEVKHNSLKFIYDDINYYSETHDNCWICVHDVRNKNNVYLVM